MKLAETVTFGGSGLDRAGQLRSDPTALAELEGDPRARVVPLWRGKPLFAGEPAAWLPLGHDILSHRRQPLLFLGLDDGAPRFAADISAWEPEELPDTLGAFFDPSEQLYPDLPEGWVFAELRGRMTRISARDSELLATARALMEWHRTHQFCARCGAKSQMVFGGWQRD